MNFKVYENLFKRKGIVLCSSFDSLSPELDNEEQELSLLLSLLCFLGLLFLLDFDLISVSIVFKLDLFGIDVYDIGNISFLIILFLDELKFDFVLLSVLN